MARYPLHTLLMVLDQRLTFANMADPTLFQDHCRLTINLQYYCTLNTAFVSGSLKIMPLKHLRDFVIPNCYKCCLISLSVRDLSSFLVSFVLL